MKEIRQSIEWNQDSANDCCKTTMFDSNGRPRVFKVTTKMLIINQFTTVDMAIHPIIKSTNLI